MRIHALPIGHVVLRQSFLYPRLGARRRLDLFLPGPWSEPMPIRAWLIEHDQERILIDMGETAEVRDAPFARHTVTPEDELPSALDAVGLGCKDVTAAVDSTRALCRTRTDDPFLTITEQMTHAVANCVNLQRLRA